MTTTLRIDPELQSLIPPLSGDELAQLEASLVAEGCRDAIVVWGGAHVIIDGHNRYAICTRHGIRFDTIEYDFDSREDVIVWMVQNQLGRRNINSYQRATLALRMKDAIAAKAKVNQGTRTDIYQNSDKSVHTLPELAKAAAVSHDTIHKVEHVERFAPESVKAAARSGDISTHRAYQLTQALAGAAEPIQHAAEKYGITEPDTIAELIQLHKRDPELSHIISMSGHIGDTPVTASPLVVREAIHNRSNGNGKVNKVAALQMSVSNEWYTPREYIHAVHAVMGGIDLDPASNDEANQIVRAASYYTIETDGLAHEWHGRVFLNPPYGKEDDASVTNQELWSSYLIEQYMLGHTTEAILLVNAVPERKWFQPLWNHLICFTNHRIVFYAPGGASGNQPTHGNAFVYFGNNQRRFADKFSPFGVIVQRWADV